MRKIVALLFITASIFIFCNCNPGRKAAASAEPATTYANHVSTIIQNSCTPCHVPSKGGRMKAYDNYDNAKNDIDEILRRIQLNPGEKGFMPFKKPKLSDSTIAVFKEWKADGLPQ